MADGWAERAQWETPPERAEIERVLAEATETLFGMEARANTFGEQQVVRGDDLRGWWESLRAAVLRPLPVTRTVSGHHVMLRNGREDVVCACGEHFRHETGGYARTEGDDLDAIQQWVKHWHEQVGSTGA